ncbi:aminotransferase class I/II-fold pyridoxal phosphate-dependent enzyme [Legionella dresdenensis]|uniref:Aminotransferase class I/II-fold pyridoxal phosphate-dependent enzyme n=1 Tax=Legionella dresdenensis TaxID=450200 RepID=A0ABV8CB85_9GAMM
MNAHILIEQLKQQGLYRQRECFTDIADSHNFCSNDYLSLRNDPRIKEAYKRGFEHYPAGSGASMAVCGYHPIHKQLEKAFAERLGVDDALVFSSGYAANLAIASLLGRLDYHILIDKDIHASIYDGIQLSRVRYSRFLHTDLNDLARKLKTVTGQYTVITESIFSMSGRKADLKRIVEMSPSCIVDEAHSFGIMGKNGMGGVLEAGLTQDDIPLRIITFGKALGFQGALVAGRAEWIDALFQCARSLIYSTAFSPALAYALLECLTVVYDAHEKREKLFNLIAYFRQKIVNTDMIWSNSQTQIQQLRLGCPYKAVKFSEALKAQGISCRAMREPTVSRKSTGLRIVLNAHHEPEHIDNLLWHLEAIYESVH